MFLTDKLNGSIKGSVCCDGRKKRGYMIKEEIEPPSVTQEGLVISYVINTMENHDVATTNISGSLLQNNV